MKIEYSEELRTDPDAREAARLKVLRAGIMAAELESLLHQAAIHANRMRSELGLIADSNGWAATLLRACEAAQGAHTRAKTATWRSPDLEARSMNETYIGNVAASGGRL